MKLINVTCCSATFELINDEIYYSKAPFDVYLNNKLVLSNVKSNVFSLCDLLPNYDYEIKVNDKLLSFKTLNASEIIEVNPFNDNDVTNALQGIIDNAISGSLININAGVYNITSLFLKSNITINLKENAILKASIKEDDFKLLDETFIDKNGNECVLSTWEGDTFKMKASIISAIEVDNTNLVGKGIIDGQAQLSTWWIDHKLKPYGRPHIIYLNKCENINVVGITVTNSPQWTIHPFFSNHLGFYNVDIINPKISPNTDGLNPQCCDDVKIIGVHFSVGDDCIAIKSGKMAMASKYKVACSNIVIRNCLMQYGHGGVVLGSEMSGGIKYLTVERCYFDHTDRGLRIKTRRGRGKLAVIDNVLFKNIKMDGVLSPLTVNMFYFCDPDGKTEYVWSKEKLPVDDRTPYLGKFTFENIYATDCECCAGYFYGLPEMPIKEINIINSSFDYNPLAKEDKPLMMTDAEVCLRRGFIFKNVDTVNINNVTAKNYEGEFIDSNSVNSISIK